MRILCGSHLKTGIRSSKGSFPPPLLWQRSAANNISGTLMDGMAMQIPMGHPGFSHCRVVQMRRLRFPKPRSRYCGGGWKGSPPGAEVEFIRIMVETVDGE